MVTNHKGENVGEKECKRKEKFFSKNSPVSGV